MPNIKERIKELRKEKNLTQEELAKKLGLNAKSNIANYESGANAPSDEIKLKMCELFNCSMDYLMGKSKFKNIEDLKNKELNEFKKQLQSKNISTSEINKLINYLFNPSNKVTYEFEDFLNSLQPEVKDFIIHFNYNSSLKMVQFVNNNISRIPILGTVKAGYDWLAEENVVDYITLKENIPNIKEYYALKITGDSMLPLLSEGDLVIVHDQDDVESGQTAVILINGEEATVKKVVKTNEGVELHSMNPYYPVKKFTYEDMKSIPVKIIGRVKEAKIKGAFE